MVTIGAVHISLVSIFVMHDTQAMEREYILLCIPTTKWCYNSDYTIYTCRWARGSRIILYNSTAGFSTYVRMENGEILWRQKIP